ncbi:helix-turn-helix transcriptional regulator [Anoxybacterium hadale]|uniref:Helix-turn-helix transcriptional regulator n=1 Tax=Anoxybacterium hadale TaxID=3408580 RepID=A0ACD1AEM8_9FIRM|nr:helix-turn-helix transcriptional regulator [Clostridiales bacterium]
MSILSKEKELYGSVIEIVSQEDGCAVYRMADGSDGIMTSYEVFPGVELIYNDFHTGECFQGPRIYRDIMEINHCRQGRFECDFPDGSCVYLEEGDLSVNMIGNRTLRSTFPLEHYHGISVVIDLEQAAGSLSGVLSDISINLYALRDSLCGCDRCFIMRATESVGHIFSELYRVPEAIKKGYYKIKILELLLFLSTVDSSAHMGEKQYFHRSQVEVIKEIKEYMTQDLERHDTLEELSKRFKIPLTAMKLCFKGVYGTTLYSYMRTYRMQAAAVMLNQTRASIAEVAGLVGYQNASKFASAFKDVIGMSPLEYRRANCGLPSNDPLTSLLQRDNPPTDWSCFD